MTVYLTSSRERLPLGFKLFLHLTFHYMHGHHTLRDSVWQPKLCKPLRITTDICNVPIYAHFYLQKISGRREAHALLLSFHFMNKNIYLLMSRNSMKNIQLRGIKSRSEFESLWHLLPKWLRNNQEKQESPSTYSYFKMYLVLWQIFVTASESISVLFLPLIGRKGFSCRMSTTGCTDSISTM